jgi:uracil-DNA glycosylase
VLSGEFSKSYFSQLKSSLQAQFKAGVKLFPPLPLTFRAFSACPFDKLKVVIIGQDPYHDDGQAEGLCFSVPNGIGVPSSLNNMYKELVADVPGFLKPKHGHLIKWAEQGVLLLNTTLTVKAHQANSHKDLGWHKFTDAVIKFINSNKSNIVWMLWGNFAKDKAKGVDTTRHKVLTAAHPSGLSASRGFFGCKHFSKCNAFLKDLNIDPIDWQI